MIMEYAGNRPVIGRNVYIAPTAVIVGDVLSVMVTTWSAFAVFPDWSVTVQVTVVSPTG